jgi:hypothetical protein
VLCALGMVRVVFERFRALYAGTCSSDGVCKTTVQGIRSTHVRVCKATGDTQHTCEGL